MKTLIAMAFIGLILSGCAHKDPEPTCYTHTYKSTEVLNNDKERGDTNLITSEITQNTTERTHCFQKPEDKTNDYTWVGYGIMIISLTSLVL